MPIVAASLWARCRLAAALYGGRRRLLVAGGGRACMATEVRVGGGGGAPSLPNTIKPVFEDPFAAEELHRGTLLARLPLTGSPSGGRLCVVGPRALQTARQLGASQLAAQDRPVALAVRGDPTSLTVFLPRMSSWTGEDTVEILCDNERSLIALLAAVEASGSGLLTVGERELQERVLRKRAALEPALFSENTALLSSATEEERRQQLHSVGVGIDFLYGAWSAEADRCRKLLAATPASESVVPLIHKYVNASMGVVGGAIAQHLRDSRRSDTRRGGVHVALFGSGGAGKTSLLNLLAQKGDAGKSAPEPTECVHETPLQIDEWPVVLADTVGFARGIQPHATTTHRLHSADIKICVLDMETIYANKSAAAIDPSVLASIDSDTIVLVNKSDLVRIRTPAPPSKTRYKNAPLGPQGGDVNRSAFRGKVPLRTDGDTTGNHVEFGDYGLRALHDLRLTDKCLQECRATLHRHVKEVKGGRFWLRVQPDHPMSAKPLGVRMGKGKGAFSHWEAKVPNRKILFEIGGGVREDIAREAFRVVRTRIPGETEFVVAPKEETMQELFERIREYSNVQPIGVWAISCTSGHGIDEFLGDLSAILQTRYGGVNTGDLDMPSERVANLTTCSRLLSSEQISAEAVAQVQKSLASIIDGQKVADAGRFLYHSKYGVLKKKQMQAQLA